MLQNTSKTLGSKKSMVYKNTHGGGNNHIWLMAFYGFQNEQKKSLLAPFLVSLNVLKLVFFTVSSDCLYKRDIIITILNEQNISIHNI